MAKRADPSWLLIAVQEIGVKEIMGIKHNPKILKYHATTSLGAETDEVPWCSAFVNWCFGEVGMIGTDKANARSWLNWGVEVDKPRRGSVVILSRGRSKWKGHCAFYIGEANGKILLLGGNQENRVMISSYDKNTILGFRDPMLF